MFTHTEIHALETGFVHIDHPGGLSCGSLWKSQRLRVELRGAWQFLKPQILRDWITVDPGDMHRIGGAGYRPAAFWVYDARERRQCVNGLHAFDDPVRQAKVDRILAEYPHRAGDLSYLFYGVPGAHFSPEDDGREYESQFAYLQRLGLLLDGEEELYRVQQLRVAELERLRELKKLGLLGELQ